VIHDVDESLRALIRRDALAGTEVEVLLDAPTREWAARRNSPTLDMYLYDIREDLRRRENGMIDVYDDEGRITARRRPPRYYKLSYLVTAWTQRPEDEHRLLSAVMACFLRQDSLPAEVLAGRLAGTRLPIAVTIALPPPEDRALSDVWSALGGELKPSLDLVVTAPFEAGGVDTAAELVREALHVNMAIRHYLDPSDRPGRETVIGGEPPDKGRIFHFVDITHPQAVPDEAGPMSARERGASSDSPSGAHPARHGRERGEGGSGRGAGGGSAGGTGDRGRGRS